MSGQKQRFVGHDAVQSRFKSLDDIEMPLLFLGPNSVGKMTFAKLLASEVHPAMVRIYERPRILDIRDLNVWSVSRGFDRWKVLIVDLTKASVFVQNALLKLLEEPPRQLKIIVVSSSEGVLNTIKSRCFIVRFYGLSVDELVEIYVGMGYDLSVAKDMALFADGQVSKGLEKRELMEMRGDVSLLFEVLPGTAAKSILNMRDGRFVGLFLDEGAKRNVLTFQNLVLSGRYGGVRGRLLLNVFFIERDN